MKAPDLVTLLARSNTHNVTGLRQVITDISEVKHAYLRKTGAASNTELGLFLEGKHQFDVAEQHIRHD